MSLHELKFIYSAWYGNSLMGAPYKQIQHVIFTFDAVARGMDAEIVPMGERGGRGE